MVEGAQQVIRETVSTCHLCHNKIKALLIEKNQQIYMKKECPGHGASEILVSNHPWYYKGLTEYYFAVMPNKMQQRRFYIYLSNACNLNCPICLLEPNQGKVSDISISRFEEVLNKNQKARFYLYGAEPTLRPDIDKWISLLKKHGKAVNMHTNGIKLADFDYLKNLKNAGLRYVSVQFDGFDDRIYKALRNHKLLDVKMKALENLRKLNISTGLNVTIAKGINEDQVEPILQFAIGSSFIKDVSFGTLSSLGSAKNNFNSAGTLLMPDELIDVVEKQTKGKVSRKSIFLFQKLYYMALSLFNLRRCYNSHQIALIRDGNAGYRTIDFLFKLDKLEKRLDEYRELIKTNRNLAAMRIFSKLALNFLEGDFFKKLKCIPINMAFPGKITDIKIPPGLLLVSFGTVCDFFKYDSAISKYCSQGFCFEADNNIVLADSTSEVLVS